jgi:hypothetical protein
MTAGPRAPGLPRRLRAVAIDALLLGAWLIATLSIAVLADSVVLASFAAACASLYEPVLTALAGGTIGHRAEYLLVADARTGQPLSFGRAMVRWVLKITTGVVSLGGLLAGWPQPLHDTWSGSAVRFRDASQVDPIQHAEHRSPVLRRGFAAVIYVIAIVFFMGWLYDSMLSDDCAIQNVCTAEERWLQAVLIIGGLALAVGAVVGAARGKLPGAE